MSILATVLSTVAILVIIPALSVLYREFLDRTGVRASVLLTTAVCVSSFAIWLAVSAFFPLISGSALEFPTASLAALSGFLVSLPVRDTTSRPVPSLLFAIAWTVVVFVPVAIAVMFPSSIGLSLANPPLDFGGALPVHIAVGSGALVVLTLARNWAVEDRSHVRPRSWLLLASGLVIWAGFITAYVGLDLTVDSVVTPRIIASGVIAPIFGIVGWLIVQRIRSATTTAIGAVAGLVSGIVAVSAAAAYFTPLWAGITGTAAGIGCSIFVSGWVRATGRHVWFIVGAHLVAAVIGFVMLGLFGDVGLIFNGQLDLLIAELRSAFVVFVWAGLVSLILWLLVRASALRAKRREAVRAG